MRRLITLLLILPALAVGQSRFGHGGSGGVSVSSLLPIIADSTLWHLQGTDTLVTDGARPIKVSGIRVSGTTRLDGNLTMNTVATEQVKLGTGSDAAPELSSAGDTNTGIRFPGSDVTTFVQGGVEKARIDGSGNAKFGVSNSLGSSNSFAAGGYNIVADFAAMGRDSYYSRVSGFHNKSYGWYGQAEGAYSYVDGLISHAEGNTSIASGNDSHAEGNRTATGRRMYPVDSYGVDDAGLGTGNKAYVIIGNGYGDLHYHFPGYSLKDTSGARIEAVYGAGSTVDATGNVYASGYTSPTDLKWALHTYAIVRGSRESEIVLKKILRSVYTAGAGTKVWYDTTATAWSDVDYIYSSYSPVLGYGNGQHAEGRLTQAVGHGAHSEGEQTIAWGAAAHAEGYGSTAISAWTHAEGYGTIASDTAAHSEGYATVASGDFSHAEGWGTTASGDYSHTEGKSTTASGLNTHAGGLSSTASGSYAFSHGNANTASGTSSCAIGEGNTASGNYSVSLGLNNVANAINAVTIGSSNLSSGGWGLALGYYANSSHYAELAHASGRFAATGDAQYSCVVMRDTTQNATADTLTFSGTENAAIWAHFTLTANQAIYFTGQVVGWVVSGDDDAEANVYYIEGLIQRDGSNNTTLPWSAVTEKFESSGLDCTVALSANDTKESLNIICTGEGNNVIRWVAVLQCTQVGG